MAVDYFVREEQIETDRTHATFHWKLHAKLVCFTGAVSATNFLKIFVYGT